MKPIMDVCRSLLPVVFAKGLKREAALAAVELSGSGEKALDFTAARALQALERELRARGMLSAAVRVQWPAAQEVNDWARRLERASVSLIFRNQSEYPLRLKAGLGEQAPAWIWVAGPPGRLAQIGCAVIGSRRSPGPYLEAAHALGRELARRGVFVVSGLAEGADTAAHRGAMMETGGTVAIPPRGILNVDLMPCRGPGAPMTCVGLGHPGAPFSAGLAIARNSVIAAMGQGVVLVASDLHGGSAYAVNWALEHRLPLWCFLGKEAGTPSGNRSLVRQGAAQPLRLDQSPQTWVDQMLPVLIRQHRRLDEEPAQPELALPLF